MNMTANRIDAIDFAKGALVLAMVVYHAMNYAGYESLPRDYMGFLPTSFIMITGFLLMQVYARRTSQRSRGVGRRLAVRGLKLLVIFTALNVAARLAWSRNHYGAELGVTEFFSDWFDVYVTANAKSVAFDVLVPIAYTILLAIAVLALRETRPSAPLLLAAVVFATCLVLDAAGWPINNLQFIGAGIIGLWFGTRDLADVDRVADSWPAVVALGLVYVAVAWTGSQSYPAQIYMTIFALVFLYAMGRRRSAERWWVGQVCLLGRYSLLGYIVQILLLQGVRVFDRLESTEQSVRAAILVALVSVMMWGVVVVVEIGRKKARLIDRVYRSVFA